MLLFKQSDSEASWAAQETDGGSWLYLEDIPTLAASGNEILHLEEGGLRQNNSSVF